VLWTSAELLFPYPTSTDTINEEMCGSGNGWVLLLRDVPWVSPHVLQQLALQENHPGLSFSCTDVLRQKREPIHYYLCAIISK